MSPKLTITKIVLGGLALFLLVFVTLIAVGPLVAGTLFSDSGQTLGNFSTNDVALADVDNDGDSDAITANNTFNLVWINNGTGIFSDSGQSLGTNDSKGVTAGLLDSDAYIDVFVANADGDNAVWLNNGSGFFNDSAQIMDPAAISLDIALGDLDADGDLDAVVANDGANQIWENDSDAGFSLAQTLAGNRSSREVVLSDVDDDDDLDVYFANGSAAFERDELWLNNGSGLFSIATQLLDGDWNEGAALGDLDNDGDPDLFLATWFGADAVWLNDGDGNFIDSGQTLSSSASTDVTLMDVDGDLDLDAIVAKWTPEADQIWLNNGSGLFSLSLEILDNAATYEIATGDLDGDSDQDLFFGDFGANHVWFRGGLPPLVAMFNVDARMNSTGQHVYPWAQPGNALLPVLLNYGPPASVDILARIDSAGGVMTDSLPFAAGQSAGTLSIDNPNPAVSETMTITLSIDNGGMRPALALVNPLSLIFIDAEQGDPFCTLCFIDWLLNVLGFEPSFWMLHHMELTELRDTPAWDHYQPFFAGNAGELGAIIAGNPALLWQSFDTLETWTPAVQAADNGQGDQVVVSQSMVNEAVELLEGIQDKAGPQLASELAFELAALEPDSLVGMTMDGVITHVAEIEHSQVFLPLIFAGRP